MAMEMSAQNTNRSQVGSGGGGIWKKIMELTVSAQNQSTDPVAWATQLSSILSSAMVALPSAELAHLLVSHICWANHVPIAWKFLDKALAFKIVPPMLVLSILSTKVIPFRQLHPLGYRLYIEFLKAHAFSLSSLVIGTNCPKIMKSIDDTLHLSQIYGLQLCEPGLLLVEFTISMVWQLLDASLDDEGFLMLAPEERSRWSIKLQDMEVDGEDYISEMEGEQSEGLRKTNTAMAIKIIGEFLQNKQTARILSLARQNMQMHWHSFIYRLQLLTANSTILKNSKLINPEILLHLASDTKMVSTGGKIKLQQEFHAAMASGALFSRAGQSLGASCSAPWLPFDLFLEDAMDGSRVAVISAVERLTGLVKALKAVNDTSWHNTFLGLWIAALRLVQRERDPCEGPVPRLDTCLCMLLSITTLAVTNVIEEEEGALMEEAEVNQNVGKEKQGGGQRRKELVTSLQLLGDYEGLLVPPRSVSLVANQSAAKALSHISGYAASDGNYKGMSGNDMPMSCSGNMWHLIVEACISRNLLDTSAYFWPGYVNVRGNQVPCTVSGQVAGWSSVMKGSSLTPAIVNVLVAIPASSLAEIETIYEIVGKGTDDEKISAATVLCGASLVRSWNIQEHIILFITRLLAPSVPTDYSGSDSYLIKCAPFLNVLLVGISSVDCLQIFSLHGLVPLLAGQLIPICEAFGSCIPKVSSVLTSGKELSCHVVFSNAFTLLLRLWRFDHLPIEKLRGDIPPLGSQQSPEYLLLIRNSQLALFGNSPRDQLKIKRLSKLLNFPLDPIFMDSFPKLKSWYRQQQECIASTLSELLPGSPCHQIVDALLGTMFGNINKSGQPLSSTTGSSNSSGSATDDASIKLQMPAWDILEATPFVLDAALTACAHGRLSPRELVTGLKDLADFLPASMAIIMSYFSAEVTRGIWKPALMNGTDWPSPAANLSSVEQQIKKILDATGVDVPSLTVGNISPATLPLPLAALISLTITYKLDKGSERFLSLTGPSLSSLSAGCPWPCMAIIASLWAQKVRRWSDFLVFSASRTVFHHNSDAVVQLLKSCFTSTLGLNSANISSNGGVGALLGHGFGSHCSGGMAPVAPGIFYLRVHRSVRDIQFITEEIVSLLMLSVRDISKSGLQNEKAEMLEKIKRERRYEQVSLSSAITRVKLAASLGSSLVWISGGSSLVDSLLKETLPAWFLSGNWLENKSGEGGGVIAMLGGYALAYFTILCGSFAWGVDSTLPASKRRARILGAHLEFLFSALDGKISLGCDWTTWQAYVSCLVSLMVSCTPLWIVDINVGVLKRLSRGLRQWNEEELALALLEKGGLNAINAATQLIIESSPNPF